MAFTVDQAFTLMEGAHERSRLAHAFLISGSRGSGKEALASKVISMLESGGGGIDLFGDAVVPEARPLDEMAGEWVRILRPRSKSRRITVEEIRELEKTLHVVSGASTWKVGVIVDADRMAAASENAFLKTLEEPPPRTLLLLLTENPAGLLPTVISRCVRMPLMGGPREPEGAELVLLEALHSVAKLGLGSMSTALGIKACFSSILNEAKEEAEAAGKEALKEEEKALRHAVEGDWLKRREEELKAVAAADYLNERAKLFDVIQSWWADVLRCKTGSGGLDFPALEPGCREVAEGASLPELLRRMDAVEDLRRSLETNAQEQLALEVGFLRIFG